MLAAAPYIDPDDPSVVAFTAVRIGDVSHTRDEGFH
jgi:hypothetical protein